ncbi:MAG: 23S rRNA (adenine(2503)-C(2))-methyltransferase RlmN [bacterium]|nr:23S rRNA (adenine(2503)-C(2))-methyltransferase RlmN [bacterium]
MRPLLAMTVAELAVVLGSRSRALALGRWLWSRATLPAALPETLPAVGARALAALAAAAVLEPPTVARRERAADGTTKYALALPGAEVETVRIPGPRRSTVCVSSQAGCTRACAFCATATLGFRRQLHAGEMLAQVFVARAGADAQAPVRNVVFMGMGEPMDNLDAVLRAVAVLTGPPLQLRAERVTVSTSGVLPGMRRFLAASPASLALSLNATTDETRRRLMPQTRTWPIAALLGALRDDAARTPGRVHFVEYVLFAGVNDGDDDADRLVALLAGIPARVNLIAHNPHPGSTLVPPSPARVLAFQRRVAGAGVRCLVRWPRGRDIAAACGQLALASSRGVRA